MQDKELDGLLALAARRAPTPSADLMDTVLAEALALQPAPGALPERPAPTRGNLLKRLAALFGGAPMLAGVVSAGVMGVVLGYLNPATMDLLTGGLTSAETMDLFPTADFLTTEG